MVARQSSEQNLTLAGSPFWQHSVEHLAARSVFREAGQQLKPSNHMGVALGNGSIRA